METPELDHALQAGIRREQDAPAPAEISHQGAPGHEQLHDSLPSVRSPDRPDSTVNPITSHIGAIHPDNVLAAYPR
jgi:hypothetical protein